VEIGNGWGFHGGRNMGFCADQQVVSGRGIRVAETFAEGMA